MQKLGKSLAVILICLAGAIAGLKLFDWYAFNEWPPIVPDLETDRPTMRTGEFYPYTGLHMQPNTRERGNEVLWDRTYLDAYDVRSGDHGFWIDFPMNKPPPKKANEIRIILTGGSGAQGWGARSNEDMFYKLLSKKLTNPSCTVEVINLAMGASVTYQNFVALNLWAHALAPDLIVSFSGHNELVVPQVTRSEAYMHASNAGAIQYVLSYAKSPAWLKWLGEYFPGLVKRTGIGQWIRFLYFSKYQSEWERKHEAFPVGTPSAEILEKLAIPMYVHALESIARDFPGVLVIAVFQPLASMPAEYRKMIREVESTTKGVTFFDLASVWERNNFYRGSLVDSVHLSNMGHQLVADYLAAFLRPKVEQHCEKVATR